MPALTYGLDGMGRSTIIGVACLMLFAACSGSGSESTPGSASDPTTAAPSPTDPPATDAPAAEAATTDPAPTDVPATESVSTEPASSDPVSTEPPTTDDGQRQPTAQSGAVVAEALSAIPVTARHLAIIAGATVQTTIVDFDLAAQQAGLPRLAEAADQRAATETLVELTVPVPVERGGSGAGAIVPLEFPPQSAWSEAAGFQDELGFSPFAITSIVELTAPPIRFSSATGDLGLAGDGVDGPRGITTFGTGDDLSTDVAGRSVARPLGRPLHLANRDDRIGVALERPLLEAWLDPEADTLADRDDYARVAALLDGAEVSSAVLFESSFDVADRGLDGSDEVPMTEPFRFVGIGVSVVDGRGVSSVVYSFDNPLFAQDALPGVDAAWREGVSLFGDGEPFSERFRIHSIEQVDSSVVVTVGVTDDGTTHQVVDLLVRGDAVFLHR